MSKYIVGEEEASYYSIPGHENVAHTRATQFCNVIEKPALIGAAAKRAGERAVFEEEKWHAIQQETDAMWREWFAANPGKAQPKKMVEEYGKDGDEAARKFISRAANDYNKYAQRIGSAVHFACEHFDEHVTVVDGMAVFDQWLIDELTARWANDLATYRYTPEKNVEQIRKHTDQYVRAIDENGIVFLDKERTICHPTLGYAGTLDALVNFTNVEGVNPTAIYVMDYKTGFVSHESLPLQLSAYRYATHEVHGDTTYARKAYIAGGCVLQLKPASYKLEFVRCDRVVFDAFQDAMRLWQWKNETSKTALGEEWR